MKPEAPEATEPQAVAAEERAPANISVADLTSRMRRKRGEQRAAAPSEPEPETQPTAPAAPDPGEQTPHAGPEPEPAGDDTEPTDPTAEADPEAPEPAEEESLTDPARAEVERLLEESKAGKPVQKLALRVHKLVNEREKAQAEVAELKERLEALESQGGPADPQAAAEEPAAEEPRKRGPRLEGAGHPALKEIDGELAHANQVLQWIYEHPEGGSLDPDDPEGTEVSEEQVRAARATWEQRRQEILADRSAQLTVLKSQVREEARKVREQAMSLYPWLKDPKSPLFKEADALLSQNPHMLQDPQGLLWACRAVAGKAAEAAAAQKPKAADPTAALQGKRTDPAREPSRQPSRPPAKAARRPAEQEALAEADERLRKTGSVNALKEKFAARRRARAAAA